MQLWHLLWEFTPFLICNARASPHNAIPTQMCYNRPMNKQISLSVLSDELSQVRTKKSVAISPTIWN